MHKPNKELYSSLEIRLGWVREGKEGRGAQLWQSERVGREVSNHESDDSGKIRETKCDTLRGSTRASQETALWRTQSQTSWHADPKQHKFPPPSHGCLAFQWHEDIFMNRQSQRHCFRTWDSSGCRDTVRLRPKVLFPALVLRQRQTIWTAL